MSFSVSVLYPSAPDAKFDMDYYLKTHMPLVQSHWQQYGLKDWKVVKFQPGADGSKPYDVQAILTFENAQSLATASEKAGGPVFGDIPNFSNQQPVLINGDLMASM